MSKSSLLKNYSYNAAYRVLDMVIPFITTPYVSRVLGEYGVGVYGYTNAVASAFILLASAGINLYGQREIAYYQSDEHMRVKTFWEIAYLKIALTLVCGAAYWAAFAWRPEYGSVFRVLMITIVAAALDISWYYQGMEDFRTMAVRNMLVRLFSAALVFLFIRRANQLALYAFLLSFPALLGNLNLWWFLRGKLKPLKLSQTHLGAHIRPALTLFIPQIAIEIYTVLDKVMLGNLASSIEEVSYYEQSQKIIRIALRLITAFGSVMLSRSANVFFTDGLQGLQENLRVSFRFTIFLGVPMMLGVAGTAYSLVPWYFGAGFAPVAPLLVLLSPIVLLIGFSNVIGTQYLVPSGQNGKYTCSVIIGACVNFVMNLILIPRYNASGAAIASLLAEGSVTAMQMLMTRREIHVAGHIAREWHCILSGILMYLLLLFIRVLVSDDVTCTILQVCLGACAYFIFLKLLGRQFLTFTHS